jgi:hypothetical protein
VGYHTVIKQLCPCDESITYILITTQYTCLNDIIKLVHTTIMRANQKNIIYYCGLFAELLEGRVLFVTQRITKKLVRKFGVSVQ